MQLTVLKMERLKTGRRLKEIAEAHELPYATLSRLECRYQKAPGKMQDKLARILGCKRDDLFDEEGFPRKAT